MTIEINDFKTVRQIQEEFSSRFPFLKLEFFMNSHVREEPSNEMPCLPEQAIGELREHSIQGIIMITPDRETGSVEQEFDLRFGLHVQIYRRQTDQWVQTAGTDMLTLQQQNDIARDAGIFYHPNHKLPE